MSKNENHKRPRYELSKRKDFKMVFTTTPMYALAVSIIWLILWLRVTSLRSKIKVSIGDDGDKKLLQRIRQHGNCADWMSIVLILMILAEGMGTPAHYLHISGVLLVIGRIAHPFGLKTENAGHPLRYFGNGTNILATLNAMFFVSINLLGL